MNLSKIIELEKKVKHITPYFRNIARSCSSLSYSTVYEYGLDSSRKLELAADNLLIGSNAFPVDQKRKLFRSLKFNFSLNDFEELPFHSCPNLWVFSVFYNNKSLGEIDLNFHSEGEKKVATITNINQAEIGDSTLRKINSLVYEDQSYSSWEVLAVNYLFSNLSKINTLRAYTSNLTSKSNISSRYDSIFTNLNFEKCTSSFHQREH